MATEKKTKTIVKKSPCPKRIPDGKSSKTPLPIQRRRDGGTLNPGPGIKK